MGRIGKFISFIRRSIASESKSDIGGGDIIEAEHFSSPGDDSVPLSGDYVMNVEHPPTGTFVSVGYIDPGNAAISKPGEKRIYSRAGSGGQAAHVHLKNDGNIDISNEAGGSVIIEPAGDVVINGVRITKDGQIITPEGVVLNFHKHAQGSDSNGDSEQDTGGPLNA